MRVPLWLWDLIGYVVLGVLAVLFAGAVLGLAWAIYGMVAR